MRPLRAKNPPGRLLDTVGDSLAVVTRNKVKLGLVAGGMAALTAGSAAISSIRRRVEGKDS